MSQDSSFAGAFDLNSQPGVMSVLASIRASALSAAEKNELRDLVFLYTNGGGDASVKIALEQKLSAHQITPVAAKKASAISPTLEFGSYRPTPTFKAPVLPEVEIAPAPPVAPAVAPAPTPVAPSVNIPAAVVPPSAPVAPAFVPPPMSTNPAPVAPPVFVPPTPVAPPPPPAPAEPVVVKDTAAETNYLERIRQIKTAVNSKVGNPVNLVDINNEVGREYMNALLEAMKKLSSGAVSEMDPVMQRLEQAYSAVEVAIANHQPVKPDAPTPVAVAPVAIPVSRSTSAPTPAPAEPVMVPRPLVATPPPPPSAPTPLDDASSPLPTRPVFVPRTPEPTPPTPIPTPAPAPVMPRPVVLEPEPEPEPEPAPRPVPPPVMAPKPPVITPAPAFTPVSTPTPASILRSDIPAIPKPMAPAESSFEEKPGIQSQTAGASLADRKKILTPQDLTDPASLETSATGDPLYTKEVDDGLEQLLSDWSLFKKSGLFGKGPHGREHPLFKKVADLQVPLLLAGRFEGATQETRQSITDYMNGWRYEQGIIYKPGETFEKYLRRVIRHILDLQKKRTQA